MALVVLLVVVVVAAAEAAASDAAPPRPHVGPVEAARMLYIQVSYLKRLQKAAAILPVINSCPAVIHQQLFSQSQTACAMHVHKQHLQTQLISTLQHHYPPGIPLVAGLGYFTLLLLLGPEMMLHHLFKISLASSNTAQQL